VIGQPDQPAVPAEQRVEDPLAGIGAFRFRIGRPGPVCVPEREQRRHLDAALLPLGHRHRVGGDAAADAELEPVACDLERPYRHVEFTGLRVGIAECAGEQPATHRFQVLDQPAGSDLGRSGHRAGWKGGRQ